MGEMKKEISQPEASRPHMPGYGILPEDQGKGLLSWGWATERLEKARNYLISTVLPDGMPHTMPVWGVWLDEGVCFSTGAQSRKARNLAVNPQCNVTVDLIDETIILEGTAAISSNPDLIRRFKAAYAPKYGWDMEGFSDPVWVVHPQKAFAFIAAGEDFAGTATRWRF